MATEAITDIHMRGKLPLLVGGTGQYVRAVTQGWKPPEVEPNEKLRDELGRMKAKNGIYWLHEKLKTLDPEAAEKIDARNFRRTIRALEVILTTGKKFSSQRGQGKSPYHLIYIGLTRPAADLYARIDARMKSMFENGLLDEVKGLLTKGYSSDLPTMSAIGYRECVHVIEGQMSVEQAKVEMRRVTRMFVRRQSNWFKESDPDIRWFHVGEENIIESIINFIRQTILE